jgi:hypothetical protein
VRFWISDADVMGLRDVSPLNQIEIVRSRPVDVTKMAYLDHGDI